MVSQSTHFLKRTLKPRKVLDLYQITHPTQLAGPGHLMQLLWASVFKRVWEVGRQHSFPAKERRHQNQKSLRVLLEAGVCLPLLENANHLGNWALPTPRTQLRCSLKAAKRAEAA